MADSITKTEPECRVTEQLNAECIVSDVLKMKAYVKKDTNIYVEQRPYSVAEQFAPYSNKTRIHFTSRFARTWSNRFSIVTD